jgi:hypothetical protein
MEVYGFVANVKNTVRSVREAMSRYGLMSFAVLGILQSANSADFDYMVESGDINNDGISELRLTPRSKLSSVFLQRPGRAMLPVQISTPNDFTPMVLERYCIEKYELPTPPPPSCQGICTSSLKVTAARSGSESYEYGVHWDYRACPITADSRWRIAKPVGSDVLDDFEWKEDEAEYELLRGDFSGDGQRDFLIRSLQPGTASIRLYRWMAMTRNIGVRRTENICTFNRREEKCTYYCSSDGSICEGERLYSYYTVSNSGAWFGDEGVEIEIIDVNSDDIDDIRIFRDGFKLHDYLHASQMGGVREVIRDGIDYEMVDIKWNGFVNALENNSSEVAFNYATKEFKKKHEALFSELDLSAMVANWSDPVLIDLNNRTAVYAVTQNENAQEFVYTIVLSWDPDYGWMLHEL